MSISNSDLDPAFQGAGQKAGTMIWRIENFKPVFIPESSHGKFFTGDSYVILKTTALKSGALRHDIHYWLGKDTSQDEAGAAAIKTVELDAALGGRAVQYRETQGHETEKFLSYFKPCIIPQQGGVASGFKHVEAEEHQTRLYMCKGKHVVHVKEVPFVRSSLNHDDVFILDTESKIFQFNGSNSSVQERGKSLEVVQYIKDTYHDGKCEIAIVEDGKIMADAEAGEFWALFGGFAPLPKKTSSDEPESTDLAPSKLFCVDKGEAHTIEADSMTRDLLETSKCYILDCASEVFVWMGKNTNLEERRTAISVVDDLLNSSDRSKAHVIRVVEGFETVTFRSRFDSWPQTNHAASSEDGKGKVAALLKKQGLNVKGLVKDEPIKEEPQPYIDCAGDLQVWCVNDQDKILLETSDQSKFYSGDCYIFQYSYPEQDREEYLIGTWFGKQSVEKDRASATTQATKMVEAMKFVPTQARFHEGNEPLLFFAILQSFIVFKGGLSEGYKNYIAEKELADDTYTEDGLALFRVQGSGPDNMQAIQVEPVASSLNSAYCYILHSGPSIFTWLGTLTTHEDHELAERQLDVVKPNMQCKVQKEGAEYEEFWELLGGKSEYRSEKIAREFEGEPRLFSCALSEGDLKVKEIYNFNQDDLMTEDIFVLDCRSDIYVWVGQQVESKHKTNALSLGEKYLEIDHLFEKLSPRTPLYVVKGGSEPAFFTRFFSWDSRKSSMHGNSFQKKLAILKNGGAPLSDKPRRRIPVSYGGRSSAPEKSQRSRSVSAFSSAERVRVRGKSPAFNALASKFENHNTRNLSTPPPNVSKLYPRSGSSDSGSQRASAIAALSTTFEVSGTREFLIPRSLKGLDVPKPRSESISRQESIDTIQEDVKEEEPEDDEALPIYPYERLITSSSNPVEDIDLTKREAYLSSEEFKEKFDMSKGAFNKLPKWKQNKLKMSLQLF